MYKTQFWAYLLKCVIECNNYFWSILQIWQTFMMYSRMMYARIPSCVSLFYSGNCLQKQLYIQTKSVLTLTLLDLSNHYRGIFHHVCHFTADCKSKKLLSKLLMADKTFSCQSHIRPDSEVWSIDWQPSTFSPPVLIQDQLHKCQIYMENRAN